MSTEGGLIVVIGVVAITIMLFLAMVSDEITF